jgi:hypothetical protein
MLRQLLAPEGPPIRAPHGDDCGSLPMNKHEWGRFALVAALAGAAACDPADRIRNGMRESDVVEILGKPTCTVEDAAKFSDELTAEPRCASSAQRIFVYSVSDRRRVRVVFGGEGAVTCVVKTDDLMH